MELMTKSPRIISIIPARGGSKGLPRKNIIDLCGKPLIAWTIESSLKSKYITQTIVSSDCEEILKVAKSHGANVLKRPAELAKDDISSEPVINHVLESFDFNFDVLILLQPTSPMRDCHDIDSAIELLLNQKAESLISVNKIDNKVLKSFIKTSEGFLTGINNNKFPFMRRQDLPPVFMPNGAMYIIKVNSYTKKKSLFIEDNTIPFLMNENKSVDIDTIEDLKLVESYIKNLND